MKKTVMPFALRMPPALVATALCMAAAGVFAQSDEALDSLIFDPVLLRDDSPVLATGNMAGTGAGRLPGVGAVDAATGYFATDFRDTPDSGTTAQVYEQTITGLEREQGPFTPDLVEQLLSLGRLYQQEQRHPEAIAVFERADHISRVNNGLYHIQQFPIVEAMVQSYLALGDFGAVNSRQYYLQFLSQKLDAGNSTPRAASLAGLGDQNMYTFGQALLETNNSDGTGRLFPGGADVPTTAEATRIHAVNSLYRAKSHYSKAISRIIENRNYGNPRLLELEYKLLETLFLTGYSGELIGNPHYYITSARRTANMPNRWNHLRRNREGYEAGTDIFERILVYMENDPETDPLEKVRVHLEYADWHLLFDWNDAAMNQYTRAWDVAQSLALTEGEIGALFSPDYPMQLPLFTALPNSRAKFGISRETELAYDGWIDMRFTINGNGTARNIRQVDQSENTTWRVEERLRRYLKNSPFRPRVENGETVSREDVNMRYYYSFQ